MTRPTLGASPSAARRLLGLPNDAGEHEVRQAFRSAARTVHPDGGSQGGDLAMLREARDLLLHHLDGDPAASARPRVFVRRRRPLLRAARSLLRRRRRPARVPTRKVH